MWGRPRDNRTMTPTTWEDVLRMPDDGNRYEYIGGRLYVTAAPATRHQRKEMGVIDLDEVFSRHLDLWDDGSA